MNRGRRAAPAVLLSITTYGLRRLSAGRWAVTARLPWETMSRTGNFAKTLAGAIAGLLVCAVVLQGTFAASAPFRTGQIAHDDSLLMLTALIGCVAGLIVGGYIAARTVRWLRASLGKAWLLLVGPGLWAWLALLVSNGIATENLPKLLIVGLVAMLASSAGVLLGARKGSS